MLQWMTGGLLTGMAAGTACLAVCGVVLLPLVLGARRDLWRSYGVLLQFSAGRLGAYLVVGALAGWCGTLLHDSPWYPWINVGLTLLAGVVLLRWLAHAQSCAGTHCGKPSMAPLLLGVVTGLSICPPFVAALATAVTSGSSLRGILYFAAFFAGTTLYLLPLPLAGGLTRWPFWLRVGRLAGVIIGFVYCLMALQQAFVVLHPPAAPHAALGSEARAVPPEARAVFPDATRGVATPDAEHVIAMHSNSTLLGYVIDTRGAPAAPIGYAGPTPVLLCVRLPEACAMVIPLPSHESPGFLRRVLNHPWWQNLQQGSLTALVAHAAAPDAVSGATLSSSALRATINGALAHLRNVAPTLREPAQPAPTGMARVAQIGAAFAAMLRVMWPFALVACAALGLVIWPGLHTKWTRWAVWLASVGLIGFYRTDYFSIVQLAALVRGTIPPACQSSWLLVVLFTLLAPLFFGRAYCLYMCPFGVISDALGRLVPWRITLPPWLAGRLRRLRYVLLLGIVLAMVALPRFPFERCEPFHALFVRNQPRAYVVFAALVLLTSLVMKRFWCAYFCVDGALLEFIHRFRWNKEPPP